VNASAATASPATPPVSTLGEAAPQGIGVGGVHEAAPTWHAYARVQVAVRKAKMRAKATAATTPATNALSAIQVTIEARYVSVRSSMRGTECDVPEVQRGEALARMVSRG